MNIADALRLRIQKIDQGTTRVHIALGGHSTEGSDVLLSNACHSAVEVHEQANRLIRQLEDMKTEADSINWRG
jgi:hypothetical protein